ncbi:MAG: polyketide cyclase [Gammaproteobacteria bacterium]|nr:polyketide cyclase [Gammaproteobacteria bacterium]
MADDHLLTTWRIQAPLEAVYSAIRDSRRWPDWWPGVQRVEQVIAGDAGGLNNVRRYVWKGTLPYRVVFEVCTTRIEHLVAIEGATEGDLEGIGRWYFARQGAISIVHFDWHVRTTRRWMNLISPVLRPLFIDNHGRIMARGGEGLARLLSSPLVSQESVDLLAGNSTPRTAL